MRVLAPCTRSRPRLFLAIASLSVCLWFASYRSARNSVCDPISALAPSDGRTAGAGSNPIDGLISDAHRAHQDLMKSTTPSLEDATKAYLARRALRPPPGFDKWHKRAVKTSSVIREVFFDQIYEDLEPFWGVGASSLRGSYIGWKWVIEVRDGKVYAPSGSFRSKTWGDMIRQLANDLPDMDVPINPLDEPRVFAPRHVVEKSMARAAIQRQQMASLPDDQVLSRKSKPTSHPVSAKAPQDWITKGAIWPHVLATCPPSASSQLENGTTLPVANFTAAKDLCVNQKIANLHGALVSPASMSITKRLIPIFSAAKLQGSNDILLPAPSYYSDDYLFTGRGWFGGGSTSVPWRDKIHGLVWRGKATGGKSNQPEWRQFHRQRMVSLLNGSQSSANGDDSHVIWPGSFATSEHTEHEVRDTTALSAWLREVSDAAFTDLFLPKTADATSREISQHYLLGKPISMQHQYRWKYLPDIDGNSLSGRFRAFLRSNSAPIKATLFKEWHDKRLILWAHFIPVDITLRDLWATMAYFLGFGHLPAHDYEGVRIACNGREWAERALRKEDMLLYAHRVLLEFARLCDDERDRLGFVLGR